MTQARSELSVIVDGVRGGVVGAADDAHLGEQRLAVGAVDPIDEHAGLTAAGAEFRA